MIPFTWRTQTWIWFSFYNLWKTISEFLRTSEQQRIGKRARMCEHQIWINSNVLWDMMPFTWKTQTSIWFSFYNLWETIIEFLRTSEQQRIGKRARMCEHQIWINSDVLWDMMPFTWRTQTSMFQTNRRLHLHALPYRRGIQYLWNNGLCLPNYTTSGHIPLHS